MEVFDPPDATVLYQDMDRFFFLTLMRLCSRLPRFRKSLTDKLFT